MNAPDQSVYEFYVFGEFYHLPWDRGEPFPFDYIIAVTFFILETIENYLVFSSKTAIFHHFYFSVLQNGLKCLFQKLT